MQNCAKSAANERNDATDARRVNELAHDRFMRPCPRALRPDPAAMQVLVIGGGAAGFFAAITAAEAGARVSIRESTGQVLAKVRISGGGRCNVTHACFDPRELVRFYPRGERELRGPFSRFQPGDTIAWFAERGVELKTEADGRMFPISDDSATIVDCLRSAAQQAGVTLELRSPVRHIARSDTGLVVDDHSYDCVCLATGGSRPGHALAQELGHHITPLAPSLFTFVARDPRLRDLAGLSMPHAQVHLNCDGARFEQSGPVLITHWGLSGPAILRLSAWAARELQATDYRASLSLNWIGCSEAQASETLHQLASSHPKQGIATRAQFGMPKRLWQALVRAAELPDTTTWATLGKAARRRLVSELTACPLRVTGKGQFKDEFVTCGGVDLSEIDTKRMASKLVPGFYVVGEALDIDGITGGFNFQNAWTSGYLAGSAMAVGD